MKRILALLIALLILALPALAETAEFSPYDYQTGYAGSNSIYYDFPDLELYLPREWEDALTVEQTEDGVSFYQTASHEKYLEEGIASGGFLFQLRASADESFRDLPAYEYLGYSENASLHFYALLPSDYPAWTGDAAIQAEYDSMSRQVPAALEKAKIRKSAWFYPGDDAVVEDGNGLA